MALQKQNVSYNFTKGVDTKTDEYQVSGKLSILENGVFQKTGAVIKRNGFSTIGASGPIVGGNAIAGYDSEIVAMNGQHLYSYAADGDSFILKGDKVAVEIHKNSIIKNNYSQSRCDSAYHSSGLKFFTWSDSSGTNEIHYSIVDEATGNNIVWNKTLVTGAYLTHAKSVGNYFVLVYQELSTGYIKYIPIPIATPGTPSAAVTLATDAGAGLSESFTVLGFNSRIYVGYSNNASGMSLFYLDSSLVKSSVTTIAENCQQILSLAGDAVTNNIWVGYANISTTIKYLVRSASLTSVLSATSVSSGTTKNMTIVAYNGAGRLYWQQSVTYTSPAVIVEFIETATLTVGGSVGTVSTLLRDAALFSEAFYFNSDFYVVTLHDSTLQGTYFVINSSGSAVAKLTPSNSGEKVSNFLTSVNAISSTSFNLAIIERDLITSDAGVLKFDVGVAEEILNFSTPMISQNLGNNLHISGGLLTMYDGVNVVEHGFNLYPEDIGVTILPYGGNAPYTGTNGSFQYSVTYDWTDNQGQIHQSAPSVPNTVETYNLITFTGNTTSGMIDITSVTFDSWGAKPGMLITGPNIPANTVITVVGTTTVQISNAATGSTTGGVFTVQAQDVKSFAVTANSKVMNFTVSGSNDADFYVIGSITAGTNQLVLEDASFITVGCEFLKLYNGSPTRAVSISGNTVTLSNNAPATYNKYFFAVTLDIYTAGTNGNSYITASTVSQAGFYNIGDKIWSSSYGWPSNINTITNVNATTGRIDLLNANTSSSLLGDVYKLFSVDHYVQVGNTITGTGFTGTVNVTAVDAASNTITVDTVSSSTGTNSYTIGNLYSIKLNIPTLRITDKIDNPVVISVWRTKLNETTFYRCTKVISPLYNDVTVDYVTFTDSVPDVDLQGDDVLYTTGGVVENIEIPAVDLLTSYRSRLIGVPAESPYSFWYSKQVIPGTPVQFSDLFTMNIDQKGGPITGLVAMDDKLVLFKQSLIYYMVGDGPTATGINNDFTQPTLISSDSGCINKKSIVITPIGTMYQSAKGIYLIDRALEVKYIGSDVEGYNDITITSAQLVSNFNQVRFTLETGITLMYDYYFNQWSVFKNYDAQDAATVGISNIAATYYMLKADGTVNKETNGQYLDNGAYIPLKIQTNWLNMAGLQGYERFYKVLVIGHYRSPHNLTFNSYFDFDETAFQDTVIPVETDPGVYQYRIFLNRQKCESIRFSLEDSGLAPLGEGFQLSAIAFEVGIKKGLNKMAAAVSYG